jgi:uncharacterized damage-inducible protein DinB
MTEHTLPLITFYQGWETYQRNLTDMIAQCSSTRLTAPAGSHRWTIGMIAQHMIANRVWWFQVWMGEGSSDLAPIAHWDPADHAYRPPQTVTELVSGLESTWDMIARALTRWTSADLVRVFAPPPVLSAAEQQRDGERTLQWIVWHTLEHEIHHGGELSLALGGYGLQGIYGNV